MIYWKSGRCWSKRWSGPPRPVSFGLWKPRASESGSNRSPTLAETYPWRVPLVGTLFSAPSSTCSPTSTGTLTTVQTFLLAAKRQHRAIINWKVADPDVPQVRNHLVLEQGRRRICRRGARTSRLRRSWRHPAGGLAERQSGDGPLARYRTRIWRPHPSTEGRALDLGVTRPEGSAPEALSNGCRAHCLDTTIVYNRLV